MACLPGCTSSKQHGGPATLKDREGALHMQRILTSEVKTHVGERVRVEGWLHSLRQLGGVNFLVVRDGWGLVQAVAEQEAEIAPLIEGKLSVESVIAVEGLVVSEAQAPGGAELHNLHVEVIIPIVEPPPLPLNKRKITASIGTLLDQAVVMNRHPVRRAILRMNAGMFASFRSTLTARGFTEIQTPKIVEAATESGANVFKLDYFGRPAYLAQSPQFYKQIMVGVFERVFEVGPVFRAEPHATIRHINEYVSLDVEFGFIRDHFDVMALLTEVVRGILTYLQDHFAAELALLEVDMPKLPVQIPWIHFPKAQQMLHDQFNVQDALGEPDLAPEHERILGSWALKEHDSDFLFVTG